MHFPNYKKAVCLFFKPAFNFLSVDIVDTTVFILLWGEGLGLLLQLCSLSELVLQKLMKAVDNQRNSWKTSDARLEFLTLRVKSYIYYL